MKCIYSLTGSLIGILCFGGSNARAAVLYSDFNTFANDANALETIILPFVGSQLNSATVGPLSFSQVDPNTFNISDVLTDIIPENEISINGIEDLDVEIADAINFFGFEFLEAEFDLIPGTSIPSVNNPFIESVFELGLFNGDQFISSVEFSPPNDTLTFVGIGSDIAFDQVQVREIVGGADNEFFGTFYVSAALPPSEDILEPGITLGLLAVLGGGMLLRYPRRKTLKN